MIAVSFAVVTVPRVALSVANIRTTGASGVRVKGIPVWSA